MVVVAVDAMGGDHAPGPEVEGAVAAVREGLAEVILVGDEPRLKRELARIGGAPKGLRLCHASEVITMEDHPGAAARSKKDSSMRVAFERVKSGEAHAVVSAGNSGAMLACGLFVLKRLPGVERPAIVTTFPSRKGVCALLDMGANVDCRPSTLAQFAVLGTVYARVLHQKPRPRVALLSNGGEAQKGTELTRGAHKLLSAALADKGFEYRGYVEGHEIFDGEIDVVVTDGFTGNVMLKTSEGVSSLVLELVREEVMRTRLGKLGASLLRGAFTRLKKKLDYAEHGGAPLVGVDGVAILAHGGSNAKAIKNAVRVAAGFADAALPRAIAEAVAAHAPLWASTAGGPAPDEPAVVGGGGSS
jgi:glycerol-3-phosphate acyltransferase PlsX